MTYEMTVAMNVTDEARYARYREAIGPLLAEFGGGFRFDFQVSRTLSEKPAHPVTRLFAIHFADQESCDAFFADPRYAAAKEAHYVGAVDGFTVLTTVVRDE